MKYFMPKQTKSTRLVRSFKRNFLSSNSVLPHVLLLMFQVGWCIRAWVGMNIPTYSYKNVVPPFNNQGWAILIATLMAIKLCAIMSRNLAFRRYVLLFTTLVWIFISSLLIMEGNVGQSAVFPTMFVIANALVYMNITYD